MNDILIKQLNLQIAALKECSVSRSGLLSRYLHFKHLIKRLNTISSNIIYISSECKSIDDMNEILINQINLQNKALKECIISLRFPRSGLNGNTQVKHLTERLNTIASNILNISSDCKRNL